MAAGKPLPPRIHLEYGDNGVAIATYPVKRFRFLLNDGSTLDVTGAVRDDSDLREAVLKLTGAERIEGVARLPDPEPVKKPTKRAPARQFG
jgi:hypothetical protein